MVNAQSVVHDWVYLGETGQSNMALWECNECRGHMTTVNIRFSPSPHMPVAIPENGSVSLYNCLEMRIRSVHDQ